MPKKLGAGALKLATGSGFYAASQWVLFVVVARFYDVSTLGLLALALAITAPLQSLCNLALRYVYAIEEEAPRSADDFLRTRAASGLLFLALVSVFIFYQPSENSDNWAYVLLAVAALRLAESGADIAAGILIRHGRYDSVLLSGFFRSLMLTGSCLFVFVPEMRLSGIIFVGAATNILVVLIHDLPKAARATEISGTRWMLHGWRLAPVCRLINLSYPLAVAHTIVLLQPALPRYALENYQGIQAVGVYSALMIFLAVGNLPVNAVSQALLPNLASTLRKGSWKELNRLLAQMIGFALTVGVSGVVIASIWGDWILAVIFGADFVGYAHLLPKAMVVATIAYVSSVFGAAATATASYKKLLPVYTIATVSTFVMCVLFVPTLGILGAILAFGIGSTVNGVAAAHILFQWRKGHA